MNKTLIVSLLLFSINSFGQNLKVIDHQLNDSFKRINYWTFNKGNTDDDLVNSYDSLEKANDHFETMLLKYTAANSQTLNFNFKNLVDSGLIIATSEDKLFRIYSWNTWTGGTMRVFRNVYQYKYKEKVESKVIKSKNDDGNLGCYYDKIHTVISSN